MTSTKHGSKMGNSGSHPLSKALKEMIEAFGMEFRVALGEAEAELAYLNSKGYIDAILTDDCDAFVFGGRTIIKNWGATLSDKISDAVAQRSIGSNKRPQVTVYSAERIHGLSRGGLILYALLQGGDYDERVPGFQPAHSFGLATCGFGDSLLREYQVKGRHISSFLVQWRDEMNAELTSNSRAFIPRSKLRIPNNFPDLKTLEYYVNPLSSATTGGGGPPLDKGEMNLPRLARFCEEYFEWGYSQGLLRRFRDFVWPGSVMHVLRRAALEADAKEREKRARSGNEDRVIRGALKPPRAEAIGTSAALVKQYLPRRNKPLKEDRLARIAGAFENRSRASRVSPRREEIPDPHPLIRSIVGARRHSCTDNLLEYHVEVCPVQLVALTKEGIKGFRGPPREPAKPMRRPPPAPQSILRLWIPGSILHQVHPGLVEDYAMEEEARASKEPKGREKRKADETEDEEKDMSCSRPLKGTQPAPATPRVVRVVGLSANCAHAAPVPAASVTAPHAQRASLAQKEGTSQVRTRL
ncbi:hypothetical protein C0992_006170 [Termitomyces sp. T32_za158]|nr:hypothetical protein C0992_006170 [Termitomyces sp. T32_za158]